MRVACDSANICVSFQCMYFKFNSTGHIMNTNKRPGIWHGLQKFSPNTKKTIRTKGIKTFSPDVGSAPSISQELVSSHPSDFSISCPLLPGIFCSDIPLLLLFLLLLSKLSCSLLSHLRAILCGIAASLADFPFSFCGKVFSLAWNLFCASLV